MSFKVWIASPERINTPRSAPSPEPTISAVGVARPNAQGQAMTSTATAERMPTISGDNSGLTQGKKAAPQKRIGRSWSANASHKARLPRLITTTAGTK